MACYVKRNVSFKICQEVKIYLNYWILALQVSLDSNTYSIIIVYDIPSSNHYEFLNYIEAFVEDYCTDLNVIIIQDFNINMFDNRSSATKRLDKIINDNALNMIVIDYTYYIYSNKTCFDLVIIMTRLICNEVCFSLLWLIMHY